MPVSRPHTGMGHYRSSSPPSEFLDTDIKIGDHLLTSGFKKHLEQFLQKATTPEDRARCLELITSLDIADHAKAQSKLLNRPADRTEDPTRCYKTDVRRPKTAMANLERYHDPINPYLTTYKKEYTAIAGPSAHAQRPQTSRKQAPHDMGRTGISTTYQNEYYGKRSRAQPIRTGSASGNRRNNPHPPEAFMIWKLAQHPATEQPYSEWHTELTDDVMDQVMRGKVASTYQQDYLGIPQGYQVKSAFGDRTDWKTRVPYTLDSTTRYSFQKPDQQPGLKGNTLRYGCNKHKDFAASGVVPTISNRHLDIQTRTTYEREYNKRCPGVREARELGRTLGAQSLEKRLNGASYTEQEMLGRMINTLKPHPPSHSGPGQAQRYKPVVPAATSLGRPDSVDQYLCDPATPGSVY